MNNAAVPSAQSRPALRRAKPARRGPGRVAGWPGEGAGEAEPAAVGEVADVLRAIRVEVEGGSGRGDRTGDRQVRGGVFRVGEPPLQADLRRAEGGGIRGDLGDLVERERPGLTGRRRAEPGGGEVAVDDHAHRLADGVAADVVRGAGEDVERLAGGLEEGDPLGIVEARRVVGGAFDEAGGARSG